MNRQTTEQDRIEQAIEGQLSPADWTAFQADIIKDAALRERYVEQLWLHSTLQAERESLGKLLEAEPAPIVVRRWPVAVWSAAAAASITLLLSLFLAPREATPETVATLIQAHNCKWAGSDLPTAENAQLQAGTLNLLEGMATLRFESGATVTMEAPAKIKILDKMHCQLLEGSVTADVPEPAHGFTIDTPDLKLVDLGTRFGVMAVKLAEEGRFGRMVSYQAYHVDSVPIEDAVNKLRLVEPEGEMVKAAKAVGICLGD